MVASRHGRTARECVRPIDLQAAGIPAKNILLALRIKNLTYSADMPLSGELKGEIGRDGLPTYLRGSLVAGKGTIINSDTPDYPMAIDEIEMNMEWDFGTTCPGGTVQDGVRRK